MDRTNGCLICGYQDDSRIGIHKHIMNDHEFKERLDALTEREVPAEDMERGA